MRLLTITLAKRSGPAYRVDPHRPLLDSLRDQGVDLHHGCRYGGHHRLYCNPFADPLQPHELKPDIATPREG